MKCDDAREYFSDYISDSLEKALAVSLENHLTTCGDCRAEVAGLRQVWASLDKMPIEEPPAFFHENIMSRLDAAISEAEETAARKRALWDWKALFRPRALTFAAVALILLLTGAEVMQTQRAEIGPLGYILRLLHPQPAPVISLQKQTGEWIPGPNGGGSVKIHLRADRVSAADANNGGIACKVSGPDNQRVEGTVGADSETVLTLPIAQAPTTGTLHLSIKLMPSEGESTTSMLEVIVPPAQSEVAPADPSAQ